MDWFSNLLALLQQQGGGFLQGLQGQAPQQGQPGRFGGLLGQQMAQQSPLIGLIGGLFNRAGQQGQPQQAPSYQQAYPVNAAPPLLAAQGPDPSQVPLPPAIQAGVTSFGTPPPLQLAQGGGAGPGIESITAATQYPSLFGNIANTLQGLNQPQSMLGPPQQKVGLPAGEAPAISPHNFLHIGSIIGAALGAMA